MSIFSQVARRKIPSSNFNLSHEVKLSCNFGELVPILCQEVLPGDKFKLSTELLIKFAPLKAPVMHRIKAKVDYFFVPNFQISKVFQDFINPKVNTDSSPVVKPYVLPADMAAACADPDTGSLIGSLPDFLGLPITQADWLSTGGTHLDIGPFAAYQHIYNSYFRDQNMEILEDADPDTTTLFLVDNYLDTQGNISVAFVQNQLDNLFKLRKSAWKKDYFTSALPSPQAGDDVLIPLGQTAPVFAHEVGNDDDPFSPDANGVKWENPDAYQTGTVAAGTNYDDYLAISGSHSLGQPENLVADLSEASMLSVNLFRQLIQLQGFKEIAERGGTRYPEMVNSFFGAFLPDYWFGRPLYLGGQIQPISIGEVVQTSQTTSGESGSAQGYRAGIASSYGKTKTVRLSAPCHGFLMGILRILPEATYQQGIERMWTRNSLYDYAFPQFANLGEQEIYNREIFASSSENTDAGIFGYAPRYAEYKTGHTHVAGKFRSDLDYWHFGRVFENLPSLNREFVMMENMDYDPFNVTDGTTEHVYVDLYNDIKARRRLPYFSRPASLL